MRIPNILKNDVTEQTTESKVTTTIDVSPATANRSPEEVEKMFADFRRELQTDINHLIDKKLDNELKAKESYPKGTPSSWRSNYEELEKRRHEETKRWMEKFQKSPVASKLTEALVVGDTFKTPWGRKLAVKLFEFDRKTYTLLNDVANMEFIVTKYNIISRLARKILGVKLPDEPEFVNNDNGKTTTRWADIANKAAKISHIKDAQPERVTSNSKDFDKSKSWEKYINNEIKKSDAK